MGIVLNNISVDLPTIGAAGAQVVNECVLPLETQICLAAGPIPTIQEMEAEAAQDHNVQASFEGPDAADAGRRLYCSNQPRCLGITCRKHRLLMQELRLSSKQSVHLLIDISLVQACTYKHTLTSITKRCRL